MQKQPFSEKSFPISCRASYVFFSKTASRQLEPRSASTSTKRPSRRRSHEQVLSEQNFLHSYHFCTPNKPFWTFFRSFLSKNQDRTSFATLCTERWHTSTALNSPTFGASKDLQLQCTPPSLSFSGPPEKHKFQVSNFKPLRKLVAQGPSFIK